MATDADAATQSTVSTAREGMRLRDRPEFTKKGPPLTMTADVVVKTAVAEMAEKNYGSVVVVDGDQKVEGVVTERDILRRLVNRGLDPEKTKLSDIMTRDVRCARADDDMLEWLRMMSNERFRRLPVVDEEGRIIQVLTQGDFVSYTWPDLFQQAAQLGKATLLRNLPIALIVGALVVYPLIVALAFGLLG